MVDSLNLKSQFLRFAFVGTTSAAVTYATLILLVELWQFDAVLASVLGYLFGAIVNYSLNYRYTFKSKQKHHEAVPKFVVVMGIGMLLNTFIMFVQINWFGIHYVVAQLVAILIVLIYNFVANRMWTFSRY